MNNPFSTSDLVKVDTSVMYPTFSEACEPALAQFRNLPEKNRTFNQLIYIVCEIVKDKSELADFENEVMRLPTASFNVEGVIGILEWEIELLNRAEAFFATFKTDELPFQPEDYISPPLT